MLAMPHSSSGRTMLFLRLITESPQVVQSCYQAGNSSYMHTPPQLYMPIDYLQAAASQAHFHLLHKQAKIANGQSCCIAYMYVQVH